MGDVASHVLIPSDDEPGRADWPIRVRAVDLNVVENTERHNTKGYHRTRTENPCLVVRRGDPFVIRIEFTRDYNRDVDGLVFVFSVADEESPTHTKNTVAIAPLVFGTSPETLRNSWTAVVKNIEEKRLTVEIKPSANAIVGEWFMDIDTKLRTDDSIPGDRYRHKDSICILFNPWCKDDLVYMEEEDKRFEYVLMHSGLIWRGSNNEMRATPWKYGQFEPDVLDCCIYLLRKVGNFSVTACSDPIKVCRHISAAVNSSDDNGVLVGRWTNTFPGGTPPVAWTGSTAILQQFFRTKKPVKYGQCWVYAGVATAVCRSLGIPARAVTNYYSAHDTHCSLTVDLFIDEKGQDVDKMNTDSIWNFHVWTEVWMARPDLEPGDYTGWQVIDATPQEKSDGLFRLGPVSVKAVKRGEILKPYDCPFVFAEVNADQISWRYLGPKQPLKIIKKNTDKIGQRISTKAVGCWDREDLTDSYKQPERTKEERDVVLKALRESNHAYSRYYLNVDLEDVSFDFDRLEDVMIGSDFVFKLKASNKNAAKAYPAQVIIRVEVMSYTGANKMPIKVNSYNVMIPPGENIIPMTYTLHVAPTFFLVKIEGEPVARKMINVTAGFINPLPKDLNGGFFMIEGPGLVQPRRVPLGRKVPPNSEIRVTFQLTPMFPGVKSIAARFSSRELSDVDGFLEVNVKSEPALTNGIALPGAE
ncbi:annulin-like [Ixodes scapularis]|uniref:annulin-like n=1 Tax=Ixodes scapularis TaxID=6945 RepID=UPI001C391FAF|nr:annulin-like [Ixodes scapularis]